MNSNEQTLNPAFTDCLSKAIASVASKELKALTDSCLKDQDRFDGVYTAISGLGQLRKLKMPNYQDEWLALMYLTWYQPRQINFAYSMIMDIMELPERAKSKILRHKRLHIVDFGCGSLATHFGAALAKLVHGTSIPQIKVDSLDSSKPMIRLGMQVWKRFKAEAEKDKQIGKRALSALDAMDPNIISDISDVNKGRTDRWLTVLHAVYKENRNETQRELEKLRRAFDPHLGFITAQTDGNDIELPKSISPFEGNNKFVLDARPIKPRLSGELKPVTNWRRRVPNRISKGLLANSNEKFVEDGFKNEVTWTGGPLVPTSRRHGVGRPSALIYTRK